MKEKIYAGTYTDKDAKGIYRFDHESGRMSDPELFVKIDDPKYLCTFGEYLACVCDVNGKGGAALIDRKGNIVSQIAIEEKGSCYIASKGNRLYLANYHLGTVSAIEFIDGELKHRKTVLIKDKGGCHQILFHEDLILVPSLFLDKVMIFDEDLNEKGYICFPEGSGPRHGIFDKKHEYLYLLSELSNELFKITVSNGQIIASTPVLKDGQTHKEGSAAIRLSEDEKYVYVSTRYEEVLSVVRTEDLKVMQVEDCHGRHPRDFMLSDDYLLCANRFSNQIVSFRLENGLIGKEVSRIGIPDAVALLKW